MIRPDNYNHLKTLGVDFVKPKKAKSGQNGPDFGFRYQNKVIWIEAVVPAPIDIPIEHLLPPEKKFKVGSEPHKEKLLRWTAVIKDKKDKITKYIEQGLIAKEDSVVIAVNSCRLQDWAFDDNGISQFPYAVEATLAVGPRMFQISKSDGKIVGPPQNAGRYSVRKEDREDISTDVFFKVEYKCISAVIGTHQRDLWKRPLWLSLVHNPLATNPLPQKHFAATREYVCDLNYVSGMEEYRMVSSFKLQKIRVGLVDVNTG